MFYRHHKDSGFTLLELMLAITILSAVTVVMYMTLSVVAMAWQRSVALSDNLNHANFVMEQLVTGLRSSYYPAGVIDSQYGFSHLDEGEGYSASDSISWVKMGSSIVGKNANFFGTPHRVDVFMHEDDKGRSIAFKAWRLHGQPAEFDPVDIMPQIISRRVIGFNVRTATARKTDGAIDWQDDWTDTNRIPIVVELEIYMDPREEGTDPLVIKRLCAIPCAYLSWKR